MKTVLKIFAAALLALMTSCCNHIEKTPTPTNRFNRVFVVYACSYNNLSNYILNNFNSLEKGEIPDKASDNVVLVVSHMPEKSGDYSTDTRPCIFRISRDEYSGKAVRDTLVFFHLGTSSTSPQMLTDALNYIQSSFPAKHYSMLFSSHATGWLPPNYKESTTLYSAKNYRPGQQWPLTKSIGAEYHGSYTNKTEMELAEFTNAIPMKLDEIIFDACLMGCVEAAYQLRNCCDRLVVSPTEILAQGMIYETMAKRIFSGEEADLEGICEDYMNYYLAQPGPSRSATISLVETAGMEHLAQCCKMLCEKYGEKIKTFDRNQVQGYFYDNKHWFYDLRDIFAVAGADEADLSELDAALESCVKYKANTDNFFNLELNNICGLSMYIPHENWTELNGYYSTLDWNNSVNLVK